MKDVKDFKYAATEQPEQHIFCVDGVFIRQIHIRNRGTMVPQHVHKHDHHTLLSLGTIGIYIDSKYQGDKSAPDMIFVSAGKMHHFLAKTDNVVIACIHNLHGKDEIEILAEAPELKLTCP